MKNFKYLINKIEKVEKDFLVINERIKEFLNVTNNKYIDFSLLSTYFDKLVEYEDFIKKEKEELLKEVSESDKEEFIATWKLVEVRLNMLLVSFKENISKIKMILWVNQNNKKTKTKEVINYFNSSEEMKEINQLLSLFKNELSVYKNLQHELWLKISLDNEIEEKLEKELQKWELLRTEMNFLNEVNHILEELFKNKEIVFVNNYNKAKKISLPWSDTIWEVYWGVELLNKLFINHDFFKIMYEYIDKEYKLNINVIDSKLTSDYKKFSNYFNELFEKIELFLNSIEALSNIEKIEKKLNYYNFINFLNWLDDISRYFTTEVFKRSKPEINNIFEIIEKIITKSNLKLLVDYINKLSDFINLYEKSYKKSFSSINWYYNTWLISKIKNAWIWWSFYKKLLSWLNEELNKKFSNFNIKNLTQYINTIDKYILNLKNINDRIEQTNIIINNFSYSTSKSFKNEFAKISNLIEPIDNQNILTNYYNTAFNNKFSKAKKAYYDRQRSYSNSSSSSRSWWSSSSSWWSSSSSSYSSSYSSSWSSKW